MSGVGDLLIPVVVLGAVIAVLLLALGLLLTRRTVLSRSMGAFDCALRRHRGWVPGVARYTDDRLEWFRLLDLSWRPRWSVYRQGLSIVERRFPEERAEISPTTDWVLVRCLYRESAPQPSGSTTVELGMSEPAYTGLATWLESAPPGEHPLLT